MFFLIDQIHTASYVDDNTPYTMGHTSHIINKLETVCKKLFKWFSDNGKKANLQKCDSFANLEANIHICFGECYIENSISQKLLE